MLEVDIDKIIPVTEARDNFNQIVDTVDGTDELYVFTKNGKPTAILCGVHHLEKLTGTKSDELMPDDGFKSEPKKEETMDDFFTQDAINKDDSITPPAVDAGSFITPQNDDLPKAEVMPTEEPAPAAIMPSADTTTAALTTPDATAAQPVAESFAAPKEAGGDITDDDFFAPLPAETPVAPVPSETPIIPATNDIDLAPAAPSTAMPTMPVAPAPAPAPAPTPAPTPSSTAEEIDPLDGLAPTPTPPPAMPVAPIATPPATPQPPIQP
jgi:prevent-host-death family protein